MCLRRPDNRHPGSRMEIVEIRLSCAHGIIVHRWRNRQDHSTPIPVKIVFSRIVSTVKAAIAWLGGGRDEARKPDGIAGLRGYLEQRRPCLLGLQGRDRRRGLGSRVTAWRSATMGCSRTGARDVGGVGSPRGGGVGRTGGGTTPWRAGRPSPGPHAPPREAASEAVETGCLSPSQALFLMGASKKSRRFLPAFSTQSMTP